MLKVKTKNKNHRSKRLELLKIATDYYGESSQRKNLRLVNVKPNFIDHEPILRVLREERI